MRWKMGTCWRYDHKTKRPQYYFQRWWVLDRWRSGNLQNWKMSYRRWPSQLSWAWQRRTNELFFLPRNVRRAVWLLPVRNFLLKLFNCPSGQYKNFQLKTYWQYDIAMVNKRLITNMDFNFCLRKANLLDGIRLTSLLATTAFAKLKKIGDTDRMILYT